MNAFNNLRIGPKIIIGYLVLTVLLTTNYLIGRLEFKRKSIQRLDNQLQHAGRIASAIQLSPGFFLRLKDELGEIDMMSRWIDTCIYESRDPEALSDEISKSLREIRSKVFHSRKTVDAFLNAIRPAEPMILEINLNELLDLKVDLTIGQIRKDLKSDLPPSITRDQYMEMRVHQALVESKGFDLMAMGQPDGPGCYCAANQHLAMTMDHLADNYKYIIVDNEAGMEHLSRMNLRKIDYMLVVSDPSARGILTARRISDLTFSLGLEVGKKCMIVNRVPEPASKELLDKINETVTEAGLPLCGLLPASNELIAQEISGRSYLTLDRSVPVMERAFSMFDTIFS